MAMFPGVPNEWFPGTIDKVQADKTYAIRYDDGDFFPNLVRRHVKAMKSLID